jgi:Cu/Ag efflux protein CusF
MRKVFIPLLVIGLFAGTAAHAQFGGGGGGGGGHGRRGGGGAPTTGDPSSSGSTGSGPSQHAPVAADQVAIVGVITALGPEPDRVTISYGAVEGLNWPAGTTLFVAEKPELLTGAKVGEKVRFKLESQHIYELTPF